MFHVHEVSDYLIPNRKGFCRGVMLVETATYSLYHAPEENQPSNNFLVENCTKTVLKRGYFGCTYFFSVGKKYIDINLHIHLKIMLWYKYQMSYLSSDLEVKSSTQLPNEFLSASACKDKPVQSSLLKQILVIRLAKIVCNISDTKLWLTIILWFNYQMSYILMLS